MEDDLYDAVENTGWAQASASETDAVAIAVAEEAESAGGFPALCADARAKRPKLSIPRPKSQAPKRPAPEAPVEDEINIARTPVRTLDFGGDGDCGCRAIACM
eukprot:2615119-Alexandrium_andersonii.AAC.1